MSNSILQKLSDIMSQSAKSKLGIANAPDENTIRLTLQEYFREKNIKPIEFDSVPEMITFISEVVGDEVFSQR